MTEAEAGLLDRLFAEAESVERGLRTRAELEALLADPNATPVSRAHDWRNHVSDAVAENWDELSLEAKLVAFAAAARLSHAEVWD